MWFGEIMSGKVRLAAFRQGQIRCAMAGLGELGCGKVR